MTIYQPEESDWKLFRKRLPEWQENYMAHLCEVYAAELTGKNKGSEAFWHIHDRIKKDARRAGVMAQMSGSNMEMHRIELLADGAITMDDLEGFSENQRERLAFLMGYDRD